MGLSKNTFDYFYHSICELLNNLQIPKNLKDIGVNENSITRLAEKALKDSAFATNPRTATLLEMKELIETTLNYGR